MPRAAKPWAAPLAWTLVVAGLVGIAQVSYRELTGKVPCPRLGPVPACHVVLAGYVLMAISLFPLRPANARRAFLAGWIPTTLIALVASLMEAIQGDVCPRSARGLPLCYLSLGLCLLIGVAVRWKSGPLSFARKSL